MANHHHNQVSLKDTTESVKARMKANFEGSGLYLAGLELFNHIVNITPSQDTDFSFGYLRTVMARSVQMDLGDDDYLKVINYFTGGQARLLDVILTFIDPESDEPHRLNKDEARLMLFEGIFYHPYVPDELVDNCKDHIMVSYTPSKIATHFYDLAHGQ